MSERLSCAIKKNALDSTKCIWLNLKSYYTQLQAVISKAQSKHQTWCKTTNKRNAQTVHYTKITQIYSFFISHHFFSLHSARFILFVSSLKHTANFCFTFNAKIFHACCLPQLSFVFWMRIGQSLYHSLWFFCVFVVSTC